MHHRDVHVVATCAGCTVSRTISRVVLNLNILVLLNQLRIRSHSVQVEFLLNDHRRLDVLVPTYTASIVGYRVPIGSLKNSILRTISVELLLLGVIVLGIRNSLFEWILTLWTLLSNDLVHVASRTVDDARLRDSIRTTATLHSGALARLVGRHALLHRLLTQFQIHFYQVCFAWVV